MVKPNKKVLNKIFSLFPLKKRIVFESNPEMACNTFPIYEKLIQMGVNEEYKFVWLVEDKKQYEDYNVKNVFFLDFPQNTMWSKLKFKYFIATSKALVYSNRFLGKYSTNQFSFYLTHGTLLKTLGTYQIHNMCDYVLSQTEVLNSVTAKELDVDLDKIVTLGFPRVDVLNVKNKCIQEMGFSEYEKVIVWMPTFRIHKGTHKVDASVNGMGLPLIENVDQFNQLNEKLKQRNVLMIIKIHPAADMSYVSVLNATNIVFFDDNEILKYGYSLYEFIGQTDALITDYSSIYYDYLHIDKPIGLILDDLEEYKQKRGIVFSSYKDNIKGYYIEKLDDFFGFVDDVALDIDIKQKERREAFRKYCTNKDFCSTERVANFIIENIRKR